MNRNRFDVVVVGAGPAGMNAAIALSSAGHQVIVIDDQPGPGGQVFRNVEGVGEDSRGIVLGADYMSGKEIVARFRACGATYWPLTEVWSIEPSWQVHWRSAQGTGQVHADQILIACGAQERPVPFPGWTLPGVLTVGAAQTLLKSAGDIPDGPVWVAGSGPLCLLYMQQLLRAGGKISGFLQTGTHWNSVSAARHLPSALTGWRDLIKGLRWMSALRRARVPVLRIRWLEAVGEGRLQEIRYVTRSGRSGSVPASLLLVHDGVIPAVHLPVAGGCRLEWSESQVAFVPLVDAWGGTGIRGLHLAGDVAGIGGANVAALSGSVAALAIDAELHGIPLAQHGAVASRLKTGRGRELAVRPFLDALYRPAESIHELPDDVIVCRCEEVTIGEIRAVATGNRPARLNEVKARTRAGMGMCQSRQCGLSIAGLIARANSEPISAIGIPSVRPPLRPVTLGELREEVQQ